MSGYPYYRDITIIGYFNYRYIFGRTLILVLGDFWRFLTLRYANANLRKTNASFGIQLRWRHHLYTSSIKYVQFLYFLQVGLSFGFSNKTQTYVCTQQISLQHLRVFPNKTKTNKVLARSTFSDINQFLASFLKCLNTLFLFLVV